MGAEASQNTERKCRRDAWKWAVGREEVLIAAATLFPLPFLPPSLPAPSFNILILVIASSSLSLLPSPYYLLCLSSVFYLQFSPRSSTFQPPSLLRHRFCVFLATCYFYSRVFSSILSSFVHFPATPRTLLAVPQSSLLRICGIQNSFDVVSLYTLTSTCAADRFRRITYAGGLVRARHTRTHKTRPPKRADRQTKQHNPRYGCGLTR